MIVPLLDLDTQYQCIRADVLAALTRVCDSQHFILGPEVKAFEREAAARLEVKHAIGVSSGTDALLVALMALGVGSGDEVITTTYSFFATAGAIVRLGATPVFVDIDPTTYNLNPAAVAAAVTSRTKAILPVHLFGLSADLDPILTAAERAGVPVVEDACQAIGATYQGGYVGGIGTAGCFSFFPSKNLGGFGDGGLVTTNDDDLARRIHLRRNQGQQPKHFHRVLGGNFRLDALQAAVLRVKLPHLTEWTEGRRRNAARYARLFREAGLLAQKHGDGGDNGSAFDPDQPVLALPAESEGHHHVYNQYVIHTARRDALRTYLESRGVSTAVYYPLPLHLQEALSSFGYGVGAFPNAEAAAAQTLALPIYSELSEQQQRHVVGCIADFYQRRSPE